MKRTAAAGGLAAIAMAGWAGPVLAADFDYCRDYAREAMRQARVAIETPACSVFIENDPARWRMDYDAHFSWCLRKKYKEVDRERYARAERLEQCARPDWRGRRDW
jgi:hypothetical protein